MHSRNWIMIDKETLRKAQMLMLEILIEVDKVCRKEGIKYWLDSGTLLGAVRHKGFIPWDDDLDICMPVEDYERFLKIGQNLLPSFLFVQTKKTDKGYRRDYAKVRTSKGKILEGSELKKNRKGYHQGIFIDIFPCITINASDYKIYRILSWLKAYPAERYTGSEKLRRFFIKLGRKLHKGWSKEDLIVVRSLEFVEPDFGIKLKDLYPLKEGEFEGHKFLIPFNPDAYLRSLYGENYMEPPPPDKRITHASLIEIYDNI